MVNKITAKKTKTFKPEVMSCPFCGRKLSYRHTVSNKVIQFSTGLYIRIKNLGYGCDSCDHKSEIYFSQTASKMCVKGYTYSSKVIAMIAYYKLKATHNSRDAICDILWAKGINISDRNIDLIFNKYRKSMALNYKANIESNYKEMIDKYHQIRLSIDLLTVDDMRFVSVRNFFTAEQIGLHVFTEGLNDPKLKATIAEYLRKDLPITYVVTVNKDSLFRKILVEYAPESTIFIAYNNY